MKEGREVAWSSWTEWNHVRRLLYSFDDTDAMIKGIKMVKAWKSRLRLGFLPVSVELTASLVAAYLETTNCTNPDQVHLSMAMALVRFVNGVTDQLQTGIYAQSVQIIAEKINIPDWIVDLRHQATHSQLPGFEVLSSGLMVALNWLDTYYWEETFTKVKSNDSMQFDEVNKLLSNYVDAIFSNLDEKGVDVFLSERKVKKKVIVRCTEVASVLSKTLHPGNVKRFISVLVQDGFLLLNPHQIELLQLIVHGGSVNNFEIIQKLELLSDFWKPLFSNILSSFSRLSEVIINHLSALTRHQDTSAYEVALFIVYKHDSSMRQKVMINFLQSPSKLGFELMKVISTVKKEHEKIEAFQNIFKDVLPSFIEKKSANIAIKPELLSDIFVKSENLITQPKKTSLVKSLDLRCSKWKLVEKEKTQDLPPIGEVFCDFSANFESGTKNDIDIEMNIGVVNTRCEEGNVCQVIENLFSYCSGDQEMDFEDEEGSTENCDDQMPWVDFAVDEGSKQEKTDTLRNKNIDPLKISFF